MVGLAVTLVAHRRMAVPAAASTPEDGAGGGRGGSLSRSSSVVSTGTISLICARSRLVMIKILGTRHLEASGPQICSVCGDQRKRFRIPGLPSSI